MELYRQTIKNTDFDPELELHMERNSTTFYPELELSRFVLANVLLGCTLFGGIRKLKKPNNLDELCLVSAVYNKEGKNFYITIKQLLQYLQETYNKNKPCENLEDIERCFSACLNDLYKEYGARFLGINGFCAYLYTKMYEKVKKDQFYNIEVKEETYDNYKNYDLVEDQLKELFDDIDITYDASQYVIKNYPISIEKQRAEFNKFCNNNNVIQVEEKVFNGYDDKLDEAIKKKFYQNNNLNLKYKLNRQQEEELRKFENEVIIITEPIEEDGFLILHCKKGKQVLLNSRGHFISKIVELQGNGREKYCKTCNFTKNRCLNVNYAHNLNSSFIADKDDIYNAEPEDILLFQTGEKNKIECGSIITKSSDMKTNFEKNEIELKQSNIGDMNKKKNDIAINKQSKEYKKNTSNVSFCDKYFGCGSCFCCNDNDQKQIINNIVNIDVSNSKEPIRNLINLDNNIDNSANKYQ